jgi:hypothetical protein
MGASLPTQIKVCFSAMETSQFTFKQNVYGYEYTISWEGYAYRVLGFSGVLLAHFPKYCENVNSKSYSKILLKLQGEIHRRCPGQMARGVLLHHDNARPHTAKAFHERTQELQWKLPEHRLTAWTWLLVTSICLAS